ncbi:hypothetical protein [Lignipirellula cremea]|uniref:Biopolymer transport protein ExbD/TolR n=1 Tax=Lignipirellula cremea TaxID=2528010 RepID=A0A518E213_9BACT|nr:hypothetical protein [Lignipirellula cremea]QDU98135.1 hypothetical protein Pla8534_59960 [Lignipirellula cremea]
MEETHGEPPRQPPHSDEAAAPEDSLPLTDGVLPGEPTSSGEEEEIVNAIEVEPVPASLADTAPVSPPATPAAATPGTATPGKTPVTVQATPGHGASAADSPRTWLLLGAVVLMPLFTLMGLCVLSMLASLLGFDEGNTTVATPSPLPQSGRKAMTSFVAPPRVKTLEIRVDGADSMKVAGKAVEQENLQQAIADAIKPGRMFSAVVPSQAIITVGPDCPYPVLAQVTSVVLDAGLKGYEIVDAASLEASSD